MSSVYLYEDEWEGIKGLLLFFIFFYFIPLPPSSV